jgi:hypothetical protein
MRVTGSLSLNYRNLGPREPGFETQIQDEIYLGDMYFGIAGPFIDNVPFQLEFHMPTAGEGSIQLFQANVAYKGFENFTFLMGKFLIPFGRYNELYKANDFLTVTRPLLFASPDSLDLAVRENSPRPPLSVGYTDIGARISYYPPSKESYVPEEITFYIVNGLGENDNRQRTFQDTDFLGIPGVPGSGIDIDYSHQNNNLAGSNNYKAPGGRVVFALGDVRLPWPVPEGILDLTGMNLGLSAAGGQYDLEGHLTYGIFGGDITFDYLGFNFSGEYVYSFNRFLAPTDTGTITSIQPGQMITDSEINKGYYIQVSAPILRKPRYGKRLTGILVFNQMFHRGPVLDLFLNPVLNGTTYPSVNAEQPNTPHATTQMEKYTAALNYQLTDHFALKAEYSYWVMGRSAIRSPTELGLVDIYQVGFAMVMGF